MAQEYDDATPTLDAADMAVVTKLGVRRQAQVGEYLYREGDVAYDFFVLVSAEVDIVVAVDGDERVIIHHGPGRFLGELNMLSGLRVFVSARVTIPGEVVAIPRDRLRQLMATDPRLGNTILAAFVARRGLLMTGAAPAIRVIGSQYSPESLSIREFLTRTRVPHEWLDADRDPQVEALLAHFGVAADGAAVGDRHRHGAAPGNSGRRRLLSRVDRRQPAEPLLRPARGRRRSSRAGGGRLRGLRRAAHARTGDDRARRPGGDELADRELPGVSDGHLRCGADPTGDHPGREVRGQPHRSVHRRLARHSRRASRGAS